MVQGNVIVTNRDFRKVVFIRKTVISDSNIKEDLVHGNFYRRNRLVTLVLAQFDWPLVVLAWQLLVLLVLVYPLIVLLVCPLVVFVCPLAVPICPFVILIWPLVISVCPLLVLVVLSVGLLMSVVIFVNRKLKIVLN